MWNCKMLIVFDNMTADMITNKKHNPVVTGLFIRCRKLNIVLVFIMQSYFAKKYYTNFYALFYYENLKQMRISTNRI